jgi:NAD dependent epimerase/dehydratase
MTILITGAGGFIGSHVAHLSLQSGYSVRALVRYNSRGSWGHLSEVPTHMRGRLDVRFGDVTDPFFVRDLVDGCDTVLHLAALIGIPYSYLAPASYLATNITGTLNILEACRHAKTRRVVVTSTSEVYGSALYTPIDEKHPLQGQSPYSASKIAADKLAESYFRSFDLPVVTLRPFNTYGPRQSSRAVIPTVLSQALSGAREIRLGNLEPKRDLTFVGDTARAFLLAAETGGIEGQTIHIGQGKAITIGQLAHLCLSLSQSTARIVNQPERLRPDNSEVEMLLCDPAKAQRVLRWSPEVSLDHGLQRTIEYIRGHLGDYKAKEYVV